jgi:hypothetical protein
LQLDPDPRKPRSLSTVFAKVFAEDFRRREGVASQRHSSGLRYLTHEFST